MRAVPEGGASDYDLSTETTVPSWDSPKGWTGFSLARDYWGSLEVGLCFSTLSLYGGCGKGCRTPGSLSLPGATRKHFLRKFAVKQS